LDLQRLERCCFWGTPEFQRFSSLYITDNDVRKEQGITNAVMVYKIMEYKMWFEVTAATT
jgi:hypothetical protein